MSLSISPRSLKPENKATDASNTGAGAGGQVRPIRIHPSPNKSVQNFKRLHRVEVS